jgi:hypothetical protein
MDNRSMLHLEQLLKRKRMSNFTLANNVMLEIQDISELRFVNYINDLAKKNLSTLMRKFNFMKNTDFSFHRFATLHGFVVIEGEDRYSSDTNYVMINENENVAIKVETKSAFLPFKFYGESSKVNHYISFFKEHFTETGPMIRWVYDEHGSYTNVPLVSRGLVKSAYPFIEGNVSDYIDDYINSDASIIVFIGPPGTGKTSLIKEIISRSTRPAHVSYDMKVMNGESLFTEFMTSDSMFLVMEDADAFLASRKEGNTMMHRFLNVGDGLISTKGKKIIFSTNLPNIEEIDPALLRPGRCFDVMSSRELTRSEAEAVREELKIPFELEDKESFSLAEITNKMRTHKQKTRTVGFY